jgi:DNA-binding transcriptional MerR regulator
VRTLHHYDRLGLLKPAIRTESRYRLYGEGELLRLQQILFYRELDFPLDDIRRIMHDPAFDPLVALQYHRQALEARRDRLTTLLQTIDKTVSQLKGESTMSTNDELYEGFPQGKAYRQEAVDKYGAKTVEQSEQHLLSINKANFQQLKAEQEEISQTLATMVNLDPTSELVQQQINRHYVNICQFWGGSVKPDDQFKVYKGLGQLYVNDPRYTSQHGQPNPAFALFMQQAMSYFTDNQ